MKPVYLIVYLHSVAGKLRRQLPEIFCFYSISVNDFSHIGRGVQMLDILKESFNSAVPGILGVEVEGQLPSYRT